MSNTRSIGTNTLADDILFNAVDMVNARHRDDPVENRIEETMNEMSYVLGSLIRDQENYVVLDAPSEAAVQGDIALMGERGELITYTRPSDELVQAFKKAVNLAGFEDLWWPESLIAWNYGIIKRYLSRFEDGRILPEVFLSLARFGEAQLCGASEEVMHVVLQDMRAGRHRTHLQWREILIGDRVVEEGYTTGFNGDMVRFMAAGPDGDVEFLIHELEFPISAQRALQGVHQQVDNDTAWEIRKLRYQAFEKKIEIKNLAHDDMTCPICMVEFENERDESENNKTGKTRHVPLYDVLDDNRQPIELTCGHVFGITCIEKWLTDNNSCPLCRTTLTGRNRKLKPISQQRLASISTYSEGEAILYFEDMEIDRRLHREIGNYARICYVIAWETLEQQFEGLLEIDSRLGTSTRNSRSHTRRAARVARWMDEDWDKVATNALALREHVKEIIRSNPDCSSDALANLKFVKMDLAKMLSAHRQRSLL